MLFFLCVLHSGKTIAACQITSTGTGTFEIPNIVVPYGTPIGTEIGNYKIHTTGGDFQGTSCAGSKGYARYKTGQPTGLKYLGLNDIYTTNIPGIGYAVCYFSCTANESTLMWGLFTSENNTVPNLSNVGFDRDWYFVLVVIGPVSSGSLQSALYAEEGLNPDTWVERIYTSGGSVKYIDCNLTNSQIQIPFGDVPIDKFKNVGDTSESKKFEIGLTCDGKANLSVSLEGEQNPGTTNTTVLALTNHGGVGVANGVGVQILYNSSPLDIGKEIALKTTSGNILETFEFSAQYYQTNDDVTPGSADATATLDITYQ